MRMRIYDLWEIVQGLSYSVLRGSARQSRWKINLLEVVETLTGKQQGRAVSENTLSEGSHPAGCEAHISVQLVDLKCRSASSIQFKVFP